MAAGLGFKTFNTGEVLTAGDTNGYLMQGILVFATEAARNAAITVPAEGQFAFTKDTNSTWYYDGAAWVASGSSSPLTTKGDVYTFSTVDARLAVGANNTVLTADSTAATGMKWAAAAAGGMTEISTTTLSGATVTLASIPQTYKSLYLLITRVTNATANGKFYININGAGQTARFTVTTETTVASAGYGALLQSPNNIDRANDDNGQAIFIHNYTSASNYNKPFHWFGYTFIGDASAWNMAGIASQQSAAVTSIVLSNTGGSLSAGTVILYGVS